MQLPEERQCTPELNSQSCPVQKLRWLVGPEYGKFWGFALRGEPDGRGQWVALDQRNSYAGDWRRGQPEGHGKESTLVRGETYRGHISNGLWCDGKVEYFEPLLLIDSIWEEGGFRYATVSRGGVQFNWVHPRWKVCLRRVQMPPWGGPALRFG